MQDSAYEMKKDRRLSESLFRSEREKNEQSKKTDSGMDHGIAHDAFSDSNGWDCCTGG